MYAYHMAQKDIIEARLFQHNNNQIECSKSAARPIMIQNDDIPSIFSVFTFNNTDYGIIIKAKNYKEQVRLFKKSIHERKSLEEAYDFMKGTDKNSDIAVWSLNSKINILSSPNFHVLKGSIQSPSLIHFDKMSNAMSINKNHADFLLIIHKGKAFEFAHTYFSKSELKTDVSSLSFSLSEYMRNASISFNRNLKEINPNAIFTTAGVFIDNRNFTSIKKIGIENHAHIMSTIKRISQYFNNNVDEFDTKLILSELLANAFEHGKIGNNAVNLIIYESENYFYLESVDLRNGTEIIKPSLQTDSREENGRGLFIVDAYSEKLFIDATSSTAMIKKKRI